MRPEPVMPIDQLPTWGSNGQYRGLFNWCLAAFWRFASKRRQLVQTVRSSTLRHRLVYQRYESMQQKPLTPQQKAI